MNLTDCGFSAWVSLYQVTVAFAGPMPTLFFRAEVMDFSTSCAARKSSRWSTFGARAASLVSSALGALEPRSIRSPFPIANFWHVLAVLLDVALVVDKFVADKLGEVGGAWTQTRHSIDNVLGQMKPVEVVEHYHIEGCRRRSLLIESMNVQIVMVCSTIGELMNQRGIPVVGEDDGLVLGEQDIEILVA
jgi:hypothetical protein